MVCYCSIQTSVSAIGACRRQCCHHAERVRRHANQHFFVCLAKTIHSKKNKGSIPSASSTIGLSNLIRPHRSVGRLSSVPETSSEHTQTHTLDQSTPKGGGWSEFLRVPPAPLYTPSPNPRGDGTGESIKLNQTGNGLRRGSRTNTSTPQTKKKKTRVRPNRAVQIRVTATTSADRG